MHGRRTQNNTVQCAGAGREYCLRLYVLVDLRPYIQIRISRPTAVHTNQNNAEFGRTSTLGGRVVLVRHITWRKWCQSQAYSWAYSPGRLLCANLEIAREENGGNSASELIQFPVISNKICKKSTINGMSWTYYIQCNHLSLLVFSSDHFTLLFYSHILWSDW